jgi:hypothetical protein
MAAVFIKTTTILTEYRFNDTNLDVGKPTGKFFNLIGEFTILKDTNITTPEIHSPTGAAWAVAAVPILPYSRSLVGCFVGLNVGDF